ncbi:MULTISPECIES: hypothetical protein [unclassified Pseudodesulfovibrio]|uniref:hypothetical protein n=1 Tax=unclassified Pseudodesulfovibrio TaxID=2661612 RepID=UPI000FEB778A|nr:MULTISPECIES: hypothetical protein [unclassified Pseudodesulfovibrio]MCJ2163261.1 hypothetical protein [Pseudodesulfovibrio sp. S3-i]RWU07242.1 hypothetical protein DWB63_01715 [Pseudodesulfovibrio sp. S3]
MGRLLQVRVSAWTFSEDEVEKKWPSLWNLVWEDSSVIPKKGVLELAAAVFDAVRAGLIPDDQAKALKEQADKVDDLRLAVEKALADWKPAEADKLIYALEDTLDVLEDIAEKF